MGKSKAINVFPRKLHSFADIVGGVVKLQGVLDPQIDEAMEKGWPLERLDAIIRAVLRAGAWELAHRKDVPARVIISEYCDVANAFVDRSETGRRQRRARSARPPVSRRRIHRTMKMAAATTNG